MTGLHLSQYRIDAELGRGGMGIVYKATDTKLNRTVALKVLPAAALSSEDDRARFVREAQSAAQLHHPNIATVFGIDEAVPVEEGKEPQPGTETRLFIAMEYIEGETVRQVVEKGPLKLQDAVNIAGQVAEALKEAHAKEIVHRDIKSANVMLTSQGVAKVLDFGLAKTNQSTMLTRMGSTLGTVAYMSPEQARGHEVDGRTDLYSLGTMLYEMVAGKLPFAGDYEQAVLYGIMNEPPEPLTAVRTGVPMELERIVAKLLSKEAEYRYQTAGDLLADLKSLSLGGSGVSRRSMAAVPGTEALPVGKAVLPIWAYGVVAVAMVVGALGAWLAKPDATTGPSPVVRMLSLDLPGFVWVTWPEVSGDGRSVVFLGADSLSNRGIYRVDVGTGAASLVPGAVGIRPRFSPDDSRILFREGGSLYSVPASGGTPLLVAQDGNWGDWLLDGSPVYSIDGALWTRSANGDPPRQLTTPDSTSETDHAIPFALPDGRHVLFDIGKPDGWSDIGLLDLEDGSIESLGPGSRPQYVSSGHLLYGDGSSRWGGPLMARPFDVKTLRFTGPAVAVHQNGMTWGYAVGPHGTFYDNLPDGADEVEDSYLYRLEDDGDLSDVLYVGDVENPRVAPDGRRMALNVEGGDDDHVIVLDLSTGVETRITYDGDSDVYAWSADGARLVVETDAEAAIWSPEGGGMLQSLPISSVGTLDWSPGGRLLVYGELRSSTLRMYNLETGHDTLFESSPSRFPRFSPNGRYVAFTQYTTDGSFSAVRAVDGSSFNRLSVGATQDRRPVWAPDGRSIYLDAYPSVLVRIPVQSDGEFRQIGRAEEVLRVGSQFWPEVASDGTVYIVAAGRQGSGSEVQTRLDVMVNWAEYLKRIAPPLTNK